jgi:hypothetical protein
MTYFLNNYAQPMPSIYAALAQQGVPGGPNMQGSANAPNLGIVRSLLPGNPGAGAAAPRGVMPQLPAQQQNGIQQIMQGGGQNSLLGQLLAQAKSSNNPSPTNTPNPQANPPQTAPNGLPLPNTNQLTAAQLLAAPQNAASQFPNSATDPGALSPAQLLNSSNPGAMGGMFNPGLYRNQNAFQALQNQSQAGWGWLSGLFGSANGTGGY